ncbi:MAG: hypothetical protein F8N37_20085 [Telmatospirillum sp.]|nr:hypothetical protein [Telmatospirillum sp.]
MAEKFNFEALLEVEDDRPFRERLVEEIMKNFAGRLPPPEKVLRLNCRTLVSVQAGWTASDALRATELSDDEILFIYFGQPNAKKKDSSVLSISKNYQTYVYAVSIPILEIIGHSNEISHLMMCLFSSVATLDKKCVVVAGPELEIVGAVLSLNDLIDSLHEVGSLVEWISCREENVANIAGFYLVERRGNIFVMKRQVPS